MKYGDLAEKILDLIYKQNGEEIKEDKLLEELSIKHSEMEKPLQYLKKLDYIKITPAFAFCFVGGNDIYGDIEDEEDNDEDSESDTISLTNKGMKYCENKNITPTPEITKPNKEVNIFSKNDFLSKNTVEGNSISGSESIFGKVISFLKKIFIK